MKKGQMLLISNALILTIATKLTLASLEAGEKLPSKVPIVALSKLPLFASLHSSESLKRNPRQNALTTKEYYDELLKNLEAQKPAPSTTENLSVDEALTVNQFLTTYLKSNNVGESDLNSPSLYEFSNPNQNEVPLQADPNDYATVPYIPAIHGLQGKPQSADQNSLLSLLNAALDTKQSGGTGAGAAAPVSTVSAAAPTAAASSIAASIATCRTNILCSLALAAAVTAATVGAVAFPVLVAGPLLGNRKKRNADQPQENIIDIIDNYQNRLGNESVKNVSRVNGSIDAFNIINPIPLPQRMESNNNSVQLTNNAALNNIQHEGKKVTDSSKPEHSLLGIQLPSLEKDNQHTYKTIHNKSNIRTLDKNESELANKNKHAFIYYLDKKGKFEEGLANRGLNLFSNLSLEFRPNKQEEQLAMRLQSDLKDIFTKFGQSINVTSIFGNQSNKQTDSSGSIKNEKQSVLEFLNFYLKNDTTKSTIVKENNNNLPTPTNPVSDPFKTISMTQLIQNLILNNHQPKETTDDSKHQQPKPAESIYQAPVKETPDETIRDIFKLLDEIQKQQKKPQQSNFGDDSPSVQQDSPPQYATSPAANKAPAQPSHFNSQPQNTIPTNTINNILQNPPGSIQNLNFILAKLPELLNEANFQRTPTNGQINWSDTRPVNNKIPQFSPTVLQSYQPYSTSGALQTPSLANLRPQTSTGGSQFSRPLTQTYLAKPHELSTETRKFYGLLCKAILEPDIPLNRVTAYIAEKCLVMRFTGALKLY